MANAPRSSSRPKLGIIQGNPNAPDKPERIPRLAQPGEVLLPRAVFYRQDLKPTARLVAGWLYDHLKPGSHTATGWQEKIAQELGIGYRTVIRSLDELWEKHIVMKVERNARKGGGWYLSYEMRVFPYEESRKASRPRFKSSKSVRSKKTRLSFDPACPKCYGAGWESLTGERGVKRCKCGQSK